MALKATPFLFASGTTLVSGGLGTWLLFAFLIIANVVMLALVVRAVRKGSGYLLER